MTLSLEGLLIRALTMRSFEAEVPSREVSAGRQKSCCTATTTHATEATSAKEARCI